MKIRVLGFHWELKGRYTLADLRGILDREAKRRMALLKQSLESGKVDGWDGLIFELVDHKHYWLGVVLKVRDQKRFCQVSKDGGGKITLTAKELEEGSKFVEVNFFLIDSQTGNGIYQYYHQSTWVDSFGALCAKVLTSHIFERHRELKEVAKKEEWPETKLRARKKELVGSLVHEVVLRKEGFTALVGTLSRIQKITMRFRDDNVGISDFGAVSEDANRMALTYSYTKDTKVSRLKKGIADIVDKVSPWRMRVEGRASDGRFEIINLVSNKDAFDELDFDEVAQGMEIDLQNPAAMLDGSVMVKRLLATAKADRVARMLNPKNVSDDDQST